MHRLLAAGFLLLTAAALPLAAAAQDATAPEATTPEAEAATPIAPAQDVDPEKLQLASQVVQASRSARTFDTLLPAVADETKMSFIRSNPQMQLGIVDVVDRVALSLVERRPELDQMLARIWASAFETDELRTILEFYQTPAGAKLAQIQTRLISAQMDAAEQWGETISQEMMRQVTAELQRMVQTEQQQLETPPAGGASIESLLGTQDATGAEGAGANAQSTESAGPAEPAPAE